MNKEQLEQKKAQLDKEYQFNVKVADRFQDLLDEETKYTAFLSGGKGIVAIKIENIEDAGRILTSFEPTHDSIEFRFAGKHPQYFGYPYKLDIKNELRMPSYLRISFQSEGMELWLEIPISQTGGLLQDYIQAYEGKLTDSEADVWYPRWSAKKVREHRFPSTEWKGQQISYYGRQKTLAEEGIAETIIENIKKVFSDC